MHGETLKLIGHMICILLHVHLVMILGKWPT